MIEVCEVPLNIFEKSHSLNSTDIKIVKASTNLINPTDSPGFKHLKNNDGFKIIKGYSQKEFNRDRQALPDSDDEIDYDLIHQSKLMSQMSIQSKISEVDSHYDSNRSRDENDDFKSVDK